MLSVGQNTVTYFSNLRRYGKGYEDNCFFTNNNIAKLDSKMMIKIMIIIITITTTTTTIIIIIIILTTTTTMIIIIMMMMMMLSKSMGCFIFFLCSLLALT